MDMEVIFSNMNIITKCTPKEEEKIKDDLTLDNPAYETAKLYSRYGTTSVPPYIFLFEELGDALLVPRGYKIPLPYKKAGDELVSVKVDYPPLQITLRDTQRVAYNHWRKDPTKGVTILPTGKGKSIYGSYLAYKTRQRVLIIVQKNDLVDGWKADIRQMFNLRPKKIGLIKAGEFRIGEQYTITTIQTLTKLPPKQLATLYDKFGMIICDEFHHSPAKSYDVLKYFRAKYFVGLTATDMRKDGLQKVMYLMFGDVCYRHPETEDDEDIMPYSVIIKESSLKFSVPAEYYFKGRIIGEKQAWALMDKGYKLKRKPTNYIEIKKAISENKEFNATVAKDIISEYRQNKSCIALFHEKEHIRLMKELLIAYGAKKDHIGLFYGDSKESDSEVKRKCESMEYRITLATFAKATEGTNVKKWERLFLVTSMNDVKSTIQAVGRVRRRLKGKEDVVVYDYHHSGVQSVKNHINTRLEAYKMTHAKIINQRAKMPVVTRGYRRG
jgi:superfamily II DNA or RNA helicase